MNNKSYNNNKPNNQYNNPNRQSQMISHNRQKLINSKDFLCHNNKEYYKRIDLKTSLEMSKKL